MASTRRPWLDWQRGVAVIFMVEVHTLDAWLAPGAGRGAIRDALLMLGGLAAPSFLFLAGLSQVMADASQARRGVPAAERRRRALSRAAWVMAVAYGFRLAEYVLGGAYRVPGGWQDILRVDILNVIGLSLAASALLVTGLPGRAQAVAAAAVAAAIALATPPVAAWQHAPSRLLDYLHATYPRANFSLFNWAAFLFAGSAVGRLLAGQERPWRLLALGGALFAAGWGTDLLPPFYRHQDFWHTSPSWLAMRLGVVVALTGALQLVPTETGAALSWIGTMKRHSLLGYLASIELTYGRAAAFLHRRLQLPGVLVGIGAMIVVTWALSVAADALDARRRSARAPAG